MNTGSIIVVYGNAFSRLNTEPKQVYVEVSKKYGDDFQDI